EIYSSWYVFNDELGTYIKIIPLDIYNIFTSVSLAYLIISDGYWNTKDSTVYLCTDNFTEGEVQILINLLNTKFGLISSKNRRVRPNGKVCWRIRFSSRGNNLVLLRSLVQPHMHTSMHYKLPTRGGAPPGCPQGPPWGWVINRTY